MLKYCGYTSSLHSPMRDRAAAWGPDALCSPRDTTAEKGRWQPTAFMWVAHEPTSLPTPALSKKTHHGDCREGHDATGLWQVHERREIPIHHRLASLRGRVGNGLIAEVSQVIREHPMHGVGGVHRGLLLDVLFELGHHNQTLGVS